MESAIAAGVDPDRYLTALKVVNATPDGADSVSNKTNTEPEQSEGADPEELEQLQMFINGCDHTDYAGSGSGGILMDAITD